MLLTRKDQFVRCLADKLLTYALGRGTERIDRCAVDAIARDLSALGLPPLCPRARHRAKRSVLETHAAKGSQEMKSHLILSRRAASGHRRVDRVALPRGDGRATATAASASKLPTRLAFLYVPNGVHMPAWRPKEVGGGSPDRPRSSHTPFKDNLMVLTGLTLDKARAHGDGGGDHVRAMSAFLTGRQPRKTHGADIHVGVSADQVAATHVGKQTRFASLRSVATGVKNSGSCDTGYSCAYSSNLSLRGEATPMTKEIDPSLVFDRLFGSPGGDMSDTRQKPTTIACSTLSTKTRIGSSPNSAPPTGHKLDEYLTGVREIEERIRKVSRWSKSAS